MSNQPPPSKEDYVHDVPHFQICSFLSSFPEQYHENKNKVLDHQLFDAKCFTYKLAQKFKRKKGKKGNLSGKKLEK